jgi:hypothetical protein
MSTRETTKWTAVNQPIAIRCGRNNRPPPKVSTTAAFAMPLASSSVRHQLRSIEESQAVITRSAANAALAQAAITTSKRNRSDAL